MRLRCIFMLYLLSCAPCGHAQGSIVAANAVLQRRMPHLAPQLHLQLTPAIPDGFRIRGSRGNIHIEAATVPTLLFGVNWYLKYVAHLNVSTNGSQLGAPGLLLPAVPEPIEKSALSPFRYALNENTDGYTTPYWSFERWQQEIDILALSGFNAILIQRGNDLAVYQAFLTMGYQDEEIRQWITHPAHQNWQWMGNMCCFVEPIPLQLMKDRAGSARRIMEQLRSLGITPVLPGFWGVVPADFAQLRAGRARRRANRALEWFPTSGLARSSRPELHPTRRGVLQQSAGTLRVHDSLRHGNFPGRRRSPGTCLSAKAPRLSSKH